jgi:hypothetical protein
MLSRLTAANCFDRLKSRAVESGRRLRAHIDRSTATSTFAKADITLVTAIGHSAQRAVVSSELTNQINLSGERCHVIGTNALKLPKR